MNLTEAGLQKRTVTALQKKKIYTYDDALRFVPRKYRDYRNIVGITECTPGEYYAVGGYLTYINKRTNNSKQYLVMKMESGTEIVNIICFNNLYLMSTYETYMYEPVVICGKVDKDPIYGYSISNPDLITSELAFRPKIYTIYPSVRGVSDTTLRKLLLEFIKESDEYLPGPVMKWLNERRPVMSYPDALRAIHYPKSPDEVERAKERLSLNDLLYFAYRFREDENASEYSTAGFPEHEMKDRFIKSLPFELTKDQEDVIRAMEEKAYYGKRINALIQGDVGSGKTIVAAAMMVEAYENGYQSVLMAPREVLARQHYTEIKNYADSMGIECVFLRSDMKAAEKKAALSSIASGKAGFVIGTHSVLSDTVEYKNLALIITDEEHLFGVEQKEKLAEKAMNGVHQISMSATPIPRTLAGILYGNSKEILAIRTMPPGRLPIKTATQKGRQSTFSFMEKEIASGHQCYVVCPAIEDNDETEIFSIEQAETIYRDYFEPKGIRIGIVNGKMSGKEMSEVIDAFVRNEIQILLSTTVVEVGVNVPNATVMVIEQADRFGLASLHQLRGRVGRSTHQSYCVLISQEEENERLQAMVRTTDGFEIAEADLKQRGAGNLIGVKQAGFDKYVDLMLANRELYGLAAAAVKEFVHTGFLVRFINVYDEHRKYAGD